MRNILPGQNQSREGWLFPLIWRFFPRSSRDSLRQAVSAALRLWQLGWGGDGCTRGVGGEMKGSFHLATWLLGERRRRSAHQSTPPYLAAAPLWSCGGSGVYGQTPSMRHTVALNGIQSRLVSVPITEMTFDSLTNAGVSKMWHYCCWWWHFTFNLTSILNRGSFWLIQTLVKSFPGQFCQFGIISKF